MKILKHSYKVLQILLFTAICPSPFLAQISAYYSSCIFNTPQNQPYLETYLTVVGKSLARKQTNNGEQNSLAVALIIKKNLEVVKTNSYRLNGPVFTTSNTPPTFIDVQRYSLPNGTYEIELTLTDANDSLKKPLLIKQTVSVMYYGSTIESSDIQALESFNKSVKLGPLTKSGYDLVPYTVNYYPESTKTLNFYFEAYNTDKLIGENQQFVYTYYLETEDGKTKLTSYGSFKKEKTSAVNPLLARIDISKLGTGNYNLVMDLKDETNGIRLQKKYFFHRLNRAVDIVALQNESEKTNLAEYVGHCNDVDTLKMYVECLWPIANGTDKERIINQALKKDPSLMKKFVVDFWQIRAADTANPLKLWSNYYQKVQIAMANFKCGKQKGYYTERGRVFLQYGAPSQRSQQLNEPNTYPYEIWLYYQATDAVTSQSFSNRRFVFVNHNLGDDCFTLIHSDMRGEITNPRWQFELTRRNNNGLADPDNNTPAGTQNNQFNEIYSNPR